MSIFLCNGLCERCKAANDCPFKNQIDEEEDKQIIGSLLDSNLPMPDIMVIYKKYLDVKRELTVENVIELLFQQGLVNLMHYLEIIKDDEGNLNQDLWHSLEHIHNIDELYSQLNRLLTPDGILLIAVPNINAPEIMFFNKKWAPFDAPRHLYHFQLKSLNELCSKYKFKIVRKYSLFQDTPYNILLSMTKNNPFQFIKGMLVFCYSIIVTLVRGPEHSSSLLVICRKA